MGPPIGAGKHNIIGYLKRATLATSDNPFNINALHHVLWDSSPMVGQNEPKINRYVEAAKKHKAPSVFLEKPLCLSPGRLYKWLLSGKINNPIKEA